MFYYYSHLFQLNAGWFYNSSREPVWVSHHSKQDGSSQAVSGKRKVLGVTEASIAVPSIHTGQNGMEDVSVAARLTNEETIIFKIQIRQSTQHLRTKRPTDGNSALVFIHNFKSDKRGWIESAVLKRLIKTRQSRFIADDADIFIHYHHIYWFQHPHCFSVTHFHWTPHDYHRLDRGIIIIGR